MTGYDMMKSRFICKLDACW